MPCLPFELALNGKTILVTGHTGFTGSWVCLWLKALGARVSGLALPPDTTPSLFAAAGLEADLPGEYADITEYARVREAMARAQPELVLHLAAQPLVLPSYRDPPRTFAVNVVGTVNVLEAARQTPGVRGVLCVTTDKVYRNHEWPWPYRECDPLGGKDPYSASKSAAEMAIDSYRHSFPRHEGKGPAIAVARGGNILGGGDWAESRLVPDFVRAVVHDRPFTLRYPRATRPWQHVLGLAQGYLQILAGLTRTDSERFERAWNLGPQDPRQYSVREVLEGLGRHWKRPDIVYEDRPLPECSSLALDSTLARDLLRWRTPWDMETLLAETAHWYRDYYRQPENARELVMEQLGRWRDGLIALGLGAYDW